MHKASWALRKSLHALVPPNGEHHADTLRDTLLVVQVEFGVDSMGYFSGMHAFRNRMVAVEKGRFDGFIDELCRLVVTCGGIVSACGGTSPYLLFSLWLEWICFDTGQEVAGSWRLSVWVCALQTGRD